MNPKKTLLLWKAYKDLSAADKKKLKNYLEKKKKTRKDLVEVRRLIKASGSDKYCLKKIDSLLASSNEIISTLCIKKEYGKVFDEVLESFFSRASSLNKLV